MGRFADSVLTPDQPKSGRFSGALLRPGEEPSSREGPPVPFDPEREELLFQDEFTLGQAAKLGLGFFATPDIESRKDMILDAVPGVSFQVDTEGQDVVTLPNGKQFLLNKEGLSATDFVDFVSSVVKFIPAGAATTKAGSLGARIAIGGGASALTAGAEDLAATALGSEQGLVRDKAIASAIGGAAAPVLEPILSRVAQPIARQIARRFPKALDAAGIPAETALRVPQRAIREADELPVPVRLSRGDATRDVSQQAFEDTALKGARGEPAKNIFKAFRSEQQDALRANVPAIQARLSGGAQQVDDLGAGAARIVDDLQTQRATAKALVSRAFETAKAKNASFMGDAVESFGKTLNKAIRQDFPVDDFPAVNSQLNQLSNLTKAKGARVKAVNVKALEAWRRRVTSAAKDAERTNPSQAEALRRMRSAYDTFRQEAVDQGLLAGDETATRAWADAIGKRAAFGRKFQDDAYIDLLSAKGATPEEALNGLFTANGIGVKKGVAETLGRLKDILPPERWNDLREEAFLRMLKTQQLGNNLDENLQPLFSGAKFNTALTKAMQDSPTIMKTLFSGEEIKLLRQFANTALRATTRTSGAVNTSNSAIEIIRRVFGTGSGLIAFVENAFLKSIRPAANAVRAQNAVTLANVRQASPLITAATTAGAREQ